MNFSECIDIAIESGRLKPEKGVEAKEAYQTAYDEALFEGLSSRAADTRASAAAVDRLGKRTSDRKWAKINEMKAAAQIWTDISKADDPAWALDNLFLKIENSYVRLFRTAHSKMVNTLENAGYKLLGRKITNLDDVVHGIYGRNVDPLSRTMADELLGVDDFFRKRANLEGANVLENPKRRLPLHQSRDRLRELKRTKGVIPARATWINEHLNGLDWDVVEWNGELVPAQMREEFLSRQYDAALTHGTSNINPNARGEASMAAKLNRPEPFYYKDSDTWLAMQKKYGEGDVFEQLMSGVEVRSMEIALMEHLGPNVTQMIKYSHDLALKRATEIDLPVVKLRGRPTMQYKTEKEIRIFNDRYAIFSHQVGNGSESVFAQGMGTTRSLASTLVLQSAFIANLGDLGLQYHSAKFYGLPTTGLLARQLTNFMAMPSKQRREAAILNGAGAESSVALALAAQRHIGAMDGSYWAKWIADKSFRLTFQTPWTQSTRHTANDTVLMAYAQFADKPLGEVPMAKAMREFGITDEDWELFRQTPPSNQEGRTFLRPLDVLARPDLDRVVAQRLSDKFFDWAVQVGRRLSPNVGTREQAALGGALDQGRWQGMAMRMLSTVKGFPTLMWSLYLKDAWHADPTLAGRAKHIGRFFVALTVMGAFITQMKELAKGNDPADMRDWKFWLRSAINGGSFGFAGDMIFGSLGDFQHGGIADILGGPQAQFLDRLKTISVDDTFDFARDVREKGLEEAIKNNKWGKDVTAFGARYMPMPWQGKLIMQRTILDDLLRQTNPAAYARLKRAQTEKANAGQPAWWPMEGAPRVPNLGNVVGLGGGG